MYVFGWEFSQVSAELAIARVEQRVQKGGNTIVEPVIRRRFISGSQNFHTLYKGLVDEWSWYENSAEQPVLIEQGFNT